MTGRQLGDEDRPQLVRELGQVRERGIVRVDSPNPDLRFLELPLLRGKIAGSDKSRRSFTNKLLHIIQSAIDDLPDGAAKNAALRLFGLDSDPTFARPTQWRTEARQMYPLLSADDWRKGMEVEILGLIASNIATSFADQTPAISTIETATDLSVVSDLEYAVTTAFWAGRYSESATASQTFLELAIGRKDYEIAALFFSNLILISRSRRRFGDVVYLMRRYFPQVPIRTLPNEYRLRILKELFVYYYEIEDFPRSLAYLERMERIDPNLMSYTPSDDWIPGTVRWRKGHLGWISDPSKKSLGNSISVAQEGIEYLRDRLPENPNTAGLASATLNVGWLYFLDGNPICLDYFEESAILASDYSPRTRIEADLAKLIAESRFPTLRQPDMVQQAKRLRVELKSGGHIARSYAFLKFDPDWQSIRQHIDRLSFGADSITRQDR
ncbi:hypothetical protein [Amycolatopsis tolypomycina]|uniref:hypothetical protein n=1 Tax=Amycolatopsis tolypomycina TaxID=208445 RepID=UPI0033B07BF3